jgi:hypothetical protein
MVCFLGKISANYDLDLYTWEKYGPNSPDFEGKNKIIIAIISSGR